MSPILRKQQICRRYIRLRTREPLNPKPRLALSIDMNFMPGSPRTGLLCTSRPSLSSSASCSPVSASPSFNLFVRSHHRPVRAPRVKFSTYGNECALEAKCLLPPPRLHTLRYAYKTRGCYIIYTHMHITCIYIYIYTHKCTNVYILYVYKNLKMYIACIYIYMCVYKCSNGYSWYIYMYMYIWHARAHARPSSREIGAP